MTPLMIDFLYVDDFIVVVNKPSGLPSQPTRDPHQTHVYEQVLDRFPNASLHHRLDTPSSGLVLLTVAPEVNRAISTAFREHSIERRYLAVLAGHPGDSGTWNQPIDGKTAVTHYKLGSARHEPLEPHWKPVEPTNFASMPPAQGIPLLETVGTVAQPGIFGLGLHCMPYR